MGQPPIQQIQLGEWADGRKLVLNDAALYDEARFNVEASVDLAEPNGDWVVGTRSSAPMFASDYRLVWRSEHASVVRNFQAWAEGYNPAGGAGDYYSVWLEASSDRVTWDTIATLPTVRDNPAGAMTVWIATVMARDLRPGETVRVRVTVTGTPHAGLGGEALHLTAQGGDIHVKARNG